MTPPVRPDLRLYASRICTTHHDGDRAESNPPRQQSPHAPKPPGPDSPHDRHTMMVTGLARISVATMMNRMAVNEDASGRSSRTALKPMSNATMSRRCAWDQWEEGRRRKRQMRLDVGQVRKLVRTMGLEPGRGGFSRGPWPFALVPCPFPPTPPILRDPPCSAIIAQTRGDAFDHFHTFLVKLQ